jgi:hypothetical protein
MNMKSIITPAAVALALTFGSSVRAGAQDRGDNRSHSRDSARSGDQRQTQSRDRAVPRDNSNNTRTRDDARAQDQTRARDNARVQDQARAQEQAQARARDNARTQEQARAQSNRSNDNRANDYRGNTNRGGVYDNRGGVYTNRGNVYDARRFGSRNVRIFPRYQRVVPYRIYTPRPYRLGFSLGIFFGRPVPYRYSYPYPVYGYTTVAPGIAYGGISFGVNPGDADVYVDGEYIGIAHDFDGAAQPLTLSAGRHRVELQSPGYEPMVFDIDVVPGQVIPYDGGMQPLR